MHSASPYEHASEITSRIGGKAFLWGACLLLVFCFLAVQTASAQTKSTDTQPPSCEVAKPVDPKKAKPSTQATAPAKPAPAKPPAQSAKSVTAPAPAKNAPAQSAKAVKAPAPAKNTPAPAKPGTTVAKGKTKPQPQPLVSTRTKAKADAITHELSPELPSNLELEISKFFGLRYRFGGEGGGGIDCSALVKQVYSDVFGVNLPRSSTEQSRLGDLENVHRDDLKTGDLVFFGANRKQVNHVGMYLAGGHFLHAARSEGVTISRLDDSYWNSRFMFSKRMRGLDAGEDDADESLGFRQEFMRDSYRLAFDRGYDTDVSFLDFGIKVNDSLEFLLSGFFLSSLADHGPAADMEPPSSSLNSIESTSEGGGFRMSAILSPLEWIKLIPSVSQVETRDERSRDRQKYGLETWMILPSTNLSVFMAAYARNQDDIFDRPLNASPDWQTMDLGIGLQYQLSDSLRFSIWGTQRANTPDARANEDSSRRPPQSDVAFQLNIKF
jgi:cell wall-associated NlpC family hydrolase